MSYAAGVVIAGLARMRLVLTASARTTGGLKKRCVTPKLVRILIGHMSGVATAAVSAYPTSVIGIVSAAIYGMTWQRSVILR